LPALEIWRSYRGRADCENRIKELKADFGLDSFNGNDFYATEAALGFTITGVQSHESIPPSGTAEFGATYPTLHHEVFSSERSDTTIKQSDN
jgi:hypothetical protein